MTKTNVPAPVLTDKGFILPSEADILAGVQADISAAFGKPLNFATSAGGKTNAMPQGQLATSMAAILGQVNDAYLFRRQAIALL